jgi:membrane associated rhomboid family serine protease
MQLGLFRPSPAVKTLMILLAVVPALMWLAAGLGHPIAAWTAMDPAAVLKGQVWRPLTYLLTYPAPSLRWLFDILILWMFASHVERALGTARFVRLFVACGVAGGVGMALQGALAAHGSFSGAMGYQAFYGVDPALIGLFIAFSLLFPDDVVNILVFLFFVPVPGRYVGIIFTLLTWLVSGCPVMGVLAAVLVTWAMIRKGLWFEGSRFQRKTRSKPKSRLQFVAPSGQKVTPIRPDPEIFRRPPEDNSEVDRILDKLRDEGMNALSHEERSTLDAHSHKLRQRDGG